MTTALAFETNAFSVPHLVEALVRRLGMLRAQRAKRLATLPLLELDRAQLEDLGLTHDDVRVALAVPRTAGEALHARRRVRALNWSPQTAA